ncbi:MAG: PD-(D/E)XK nuclease family transposase [Bacteroidales bacterium]|nr:PD-(D/E)XK nuclease family transposase [Bacteroidales bacterium]
MASNPIPVQAGKYACILYDSTFKVVVVNRSQPELVRQIIELLIPGKHISSLTFLDKEQNGLVVSEKKTNFDLLCRDDQTGEEFIVEMQFGEQRTYRERMLSYATYPIRRQLAEKINRRLSGEDIDKMDYSLRPVYVLSFLNFALPHENEHALAENGLISSYSIRNARNGELMTDALHFIYVEMGRLPYEANEEAKCKSLLEKFIFSLKYMHQMTAPPESFTEDILRLLYHATELGTMNIKQREEYEEKMRNELDISLEKRFVAEKSRAEGLAEGRAEGREDALLETAQKLKAMGISSEQIKEATGIDL